MSVSFAQAGGVGIVEIDHPPANSYDLAFMKEFGDSVDAAIASGVGAVIVRSANEKFFSAGADIKRFIENDTASNMGMIRASHATFDRMAAAGQVFIAHIAGHALGGGLEIALACDLRYASEGRFKLGTPEITLGLLPGNGGTQRLTRLLGPGVAMDLLITGRPIMGDEALRLGIVNGIFAADEADAKVREIAETFASGPRTALAAIKRCVYEGGQMKLADGLALERDGIEMLFDTADAKEGLNAFAEKRTPEFGKA